MLKEQELNAVQDIRIMADGRPAFAWFNEISMLKAELRREGEQIAFNKHLGKVLRIVEIKEWADQITGDIHLVLKRDSMLNHDALDEPEKYLQRIV